MQCEPELLEAVNKKGLCITNSDKLDGILAIGTTELNRHSAHTGTNTHLLDHLSQYSGDSPVYLFFSSNRPLCIIQPQSEQTTVCSHFHHRPCMFKFLLHALFICSQESTSALFILLFLIFYVSTFLNSTLIATGVTELRPVSAWNANVIFWWKWTCCVSTSDWVKLCSRSLLFLCKLHQWLWIWTLAIYFTVHELDYSL